MTRRRIQPEDRTAVADFLEHNWPGQVVISRGKCYQPEELDGYVDWRDAKIAGLLTFVQDGKDLHLLTLNSTLEGQHIGSSLMLMAIDEARRNDVRRIWFTTSNDNLRLMAFYQRLGFRLTKVYVGAVDDARKLRPQIPETGHDGIAIHDELVLELNLKPSTAAS